MDPGVKPQDDKEEEGPKSPRMTERRKAEMTEGKMDRGKTWKHIGKGLF